MTAPLTSSLAGQPGSASRWRRLFLVSGWSSIAFVALLLTALALDFVAPPPVDGGAETLEFIAAHKLVYIAEQLLWVLPNLLAVVAILGLAAALIPVDRVLVLLAGVVGGLPWALFLAIPTTSRGSLTLVYLSDRYMGASPQERGAYSAAAEAIVAENNTPSAAGMLSAFGILVVSLLMTRSDLSRAIAWIGVATGALGVVSEALRYAAPYFYWGYGVLLWVWFVGVGVALLRHARAPRSMPRRAGPWALPESGALADDGAAGHERKGVRDD